MAYRVLTEDEESETIVLFMLAQERDHHSHSVNRDRYQRMLKDLPPGPFRERIQHLLAETNDRLVEVEAIIAATVPQMPPADRVSAIREALKAKG